MQSRRVAVSAAGLLAALAGLCLAEAPEALCEEPRLERPNIVYFEAGGNSLFGANYERLLSRHTSLRVGIGAFPVNEGSGAVTAVCMPNVLVGSARHQLEAGVAAVVWGSSGQVNVRPAASAGYRHRASGGFFFRAGVGADFSDGRLWVRPGVSFGKSFQ